MNGGLFYKAQSVASKSFDDSYHLGHTLLLASIASAPGGFQGSPLTFPQQALIYSALEVLGGVAAAGVFRITHEAGRVYCVRFPCNGTRLSGAG